jgi:hypothetical protein
VEDVALISAGKSREDRRDVDDLFIEACDRAGAVAEGFGAFVGFERDGGDAEADAGAEHAES